MITAEQKAHWDPFGFLIFRQLFAPDEFKVMRVATIEVVDQQGGRDAPVAPCPDRMDVYGV